MKSITSTEGDFDVDLERGCPCSEGNVSPISSPNPGAKKQAHKLLTKGYGVIDDASLSSEDGGSYYINIDNHNKVDDAKVTLVNRVEDRGETLDNEETKAVKEKRKKMSNKKALKPPRPPRGPSLDAADQKLIKEIADFTMLKRARMERMKVLKKAKLVESSSHSSTNNAIALVFTVIFFVVILLQGLSSAAKPTSVSFNVSPESARASEANLISVQYYPNAAVGSMDAPVHDPPSLVVQAQVAGLDVQERPSRVAG